MKIYFRIAVCIVSGLALLVTGYCFGLVVQQKYDIRFAAWWEMTAAMKLHKALSVGDYDGARRDAINHMVHGEMHLDDGLEFGQWDILLRESLDNHLGTGFHRAALAHIIGMRRMEPNIVYPLALQPELDAFTPRNESEQKCLDWYASYDPAGR